jgi:hypothetical protein
MPAIHAFHLHDAAQFSRPPIVHTQTEENSMMGNQEQAQQTGTRNETYDIISVVYHALQGAENCSRYLQDAQEGQLRSFFEQALQAQRQLADQGKQILQQQLMSSDQSGGSAFGWEQSSQSQSGQFTSSEPNMGGGGQGSSSSY